MFLSDGDGTYTEDAQHISIVTDSNDKTGSALADYNNDGDQDLFVARYASGEKGYLWKNLSVPSGHGRFVNMANAARVKDTSGQRSACWGDYDNDGDLDLYIVTRSGLPNVLYQNQGPPNWKFEVVDEGAGAPGDGHDAVFVDYDNDGDLDLAITQEDGTNTLLQNSTNNSNYLKVRVIGRGAGATNTAAVGIRVELWDEAGTMFLAQREIGSARGAGTEPLWVHFGGVDPSAAYQVKVYFTSRSFADPYAVPVVPADVSTTFAQGLTIAQMLTVQEPVGVRILHWRERPVTSIE